MARFGNLHPDAVVVNATVMTRRILILDFIRPFYRGDRLPNEGRASAPPMMPQWAPSVQSLACVQRQGPVVAVGCAAQDQVTVPFHDPECRMADGRSIQVAGEQKFELGEP